MVRKTLLDNVMQFRSHSLEKGIFEKRNIKTFKMQQRASSLPSKTLLKPKTNLTLIFFIFNTSLMSSYDSTRFIRKKMDTDENNSSA